MYKPNDTERACAENDVQSFGIGFVVDGKRVHPSQVLVFRAPGDPVMVERARCAAIVQSLHGDSNIDFALNQRICCNGVDCGCQGATVGSYLEYQLTRAIREPTV